MRRHLLLALALAPVAALAQPDARYTINGRIVDAETGAPIAGARVIALNNWQTLGGPVVSGPDGHFSIPDRTPGCFTLEAYIPNETVIYHQFSDRSSECVPIGPDQPAADVTFPAQRHASLTGRVRDEFGDPVSAQVQLFSRIWRDGHLDLEPFFQTEADDRGQFHFIDLPAGAYFLCAVVFCTSQTTCVAPPQGSADYATRAERRYYSHVFYPAEPPATFRLDWAQNLDIGLTVKSVQPTPVRVHMAECASLSMLRNGVRDLWLNPTALGGGITEFAVVEPGSYRLVASSERGRTEQTVAIDNSSARSIELALEPVGQIELAVHAPPGFEKEAGRSASASAQPAKAITKPSGRPSIPTSLARLRISPTCCPELTGFVRSPPNRSAWCLQLSPDRKSFTALSPSPPA